jgi:shikimate dehydrogenase
MPAGGEFEALVLGAGGAARAAVVACQSIGAHRVYVSSRKWIGDRADWPHDSDFRALDATPVLWSGPAGAAMSVGAAAPRCRIVVQATSAGMSGIGGGGAVAELLPWSNLDRSGFVYDVVYNPPETEFLRAAARAGVAHEGGLSMLVGQAAAAIELWLAQRPDSDLMNAAAQNALFGAGS